MTYRIIIAPSALTMLKAVRDRRVRESLIATIDRLAESPEQQGKPLLGELSGCRSVRAVGQRYRILYRVEGKKILVTVIAIGMRKEGDKRDIYRLARKLMRLRLMEQP